MDRHGHKDRGQEWVEVDMISTNFRMEEKKMPSVDKNFIIEDRCINMADRYITMVKGDTLSFGVEITDQEGNWLDIDAANFICKKNYTDQTAIFSKTLGSGITRDSAGHYAVRVAPSDTSSAEAGLYYYAFRVTKGSDVYTIMRGILELDPEVTSV